MTEIWDFNSAAERAANSVVGIYLAGAGGGWEIASGVLVRLGGRSFVLTAGHNLEEHAVDRIFLMFPSRVAVPGVGGRSILRCRFAKEPDVGVIELDERDRSYWAHMIELGEEAFLPLENVEPSAYLVFSGFPAQTTHADTLKPEEDPAAPRIFRSAPVAIRATIATGVRSSFEPPIGRGIHILYHGDTFFDPETNQEMALPQPHGLSGGPLLSVSPTATVLLGLGRSQHGSPNTYEWCEPAFEALRLLFDHTAQDVARMAREILNRLDA